MKCLWFDTETTGLDPYKSGLIQLSGIIEIDGQIKDIFNYYIKPFPQDIITDDAIACNGYTKEQLATDPKFLNPKEVYKAFTSLLDKYVDKFDKTDKFISMGQNVKFDMDFTRQFFIKNGDKFFGSYVSHHSVDLLSFSYMLKYLQLIDIENCKLETLAKYLNVELKAHNALEDITATRTIFNILVDRFIVKGDKENG